MYVKCVIGAILTLLSGITNASTRPAPEQIEGLGLARSCFFGVQANYDEWRDRVISKNQKVDQLEAEKRFDKLFSNEAHARFKENLNCYLFPTQIDDVVVPVYYSAPKDVASKSKLPVIIFNRGGNGKFGAINFGHLMRTIMPLSEKGFIVLASKYRGSSKGRRNGHTHVGWDEFGGEDVKDVLELVNVIDRLPGADPENIFMVGHSRGGMMTYLAASRSDRFKAIASIAGISDLEMIAKTRPRFADMLERRIKYNTQTIDQEFHKRSAIHWFGEASTKPPLLMIHGELDQRVSVDQTKKLAARLADLEYPHSVTIYEDGDHDLMPYWDEVLTELSRWFKQYSQ